MDNHASRTTRLAALLCLALGAYAAPAVSQQILKQQPLPPIDVDEYTVAPTKTPGGQSAYLHKVVIRDMMQESITAAELVLVGHDSFSVQSIHRATLSQSVKLDQQGSGAWTTPQGTASEFAVLVEKVRYHNGEIWSAEHEDMATAIRTIDPEFETSRLQDEPQPAVVVEVEVKIE